MRFTAYSALNSDARRVLARTDSLANFGELSGADLYEAFDDLRRPGFLNIAAKAAATITGPDRTVLSYVERLTASRPAPRPPAHPTSIRP